MWPWHLNGDGRRNAYRWSCCFPMAPHLRHCLGQLASSLALLESFELPELEAEFSPFTQVPCQASLGTSGQFAHKIYNPEDISYTGNYSHLSCDFAPATKWIQYSGLVLKLISMETITVPWSSLIRECLLEGWTQSSLEEIPTPSPPAHSSITWPKSALSHFILTSPKIPWLACKPDKDLREHWYWQDLEKLQMWRNCNLHILPVGCKYQPLWETVWQFLKWLNIKLPLI